MDATADRQANYDRYIGMVGEPQRAATPLEADALRRFVQAVMDPDPLFFDDARAGESKFRGLAAPALYPVHAFRLQGGAPDPLASVQKDPDADGTAGNDGILFGLPPIESRYKRLLNGGNEIEFHRCLAVGERCTATARYANVTLKNGKSGNMLLVDVETTFRSEEGDLLLVNRQTLIWR